MEEELYNVILENMEFKEAIEVIKEIEENKN